MHIYIYIHVVVVLELREFFAFHFSIPLQGKKEALMLPTVKLLVRLLLDKDPLVKCKAALALESIAITTPGKYSCLKEGAIAHLVPLIDESLSETRVNALKARPTALAFVFLLI